MSRELRDPNLPAGILVYNADGRFIRNDGVELKPADGNPWYVMATIFGEQNGDSLNNELAEKNRRAWNRWVLHSLPSEFQAVLAKDYGFDDAEVEALNAVCLDEISRKFMERTELKKLPKIPKEIDFSNTYFNKQICFKKYVFPVKTKFISSHFTKFVDFIEARFHYTADFNNVYFLQRVYFQKAKFSRIASFQQVEFVGGADIHCVSYGEGVHFKASFFGNNTSFSSTHFKMGANFSCATFAGDIDFNTAQFDGKADFRSATFKAKTDFSNAKFKTHVPEFHAAELFDDTTFTLPENPLENWPPLQGERVMHAADQKRAYNRLRLFMNRALHIKEEQFFHRQEMRCERAIAKGSEEKLYAAFELLSNYGSSILRPLVALIVLVLLGAIPMEFHLLMGGKGDCVPEILSIGIQPEAVGWSFGNVFSFLSFGKTYYADNLC